MHGAKAALEVSGFSAPRTHDGVSNRFGLHIALTGLIEHRFASEIGKLYSLRNQADYDADAVFTEAGTQDATERAEAFLNRIHQLLAEVIPTEQLR